ncbi:MAG: FAD-dependent oxidoreductase [Deinococcales bacterium]|nr:FAD-dependent oxidoreductase [Deinococcales bacterium]
MSRHVVVVGAGIVGLASAYYLRRAGFEVTVLERDPEERATTSHGNAGMVVPSHFVPLAAPGVVAQGLRWMADPRSPFYVKPRLRADLLAWGWRFWRAGTTAHVTRSAPLLLALNLASRDAYVELDAELGGGFAFERQGLTMLCATERGLEEEARVAALAAGLGMRAEVLDGREAQAREPGIELAVAGGVHYPEDAHLDPAAFMRVLQRRLAADGVALRFGTRVAGFEATNGRVEGVRVAAGELVRADHVVLAAGSWTGALARPLGLRLPMQPGKGYSLTLERPSQRLRVPSILAEARVAVTRMGERLRVGGTMELAGFDEGANEARVQGIIGSALRYFPGLARAELETAPRWHGFRPCSPDGLPYLGRSPRHANLTVATGHSMMGVSLAPVTGRLVAQLVAGEAPQLDVTALRVDRFG